MNEHLRIGVCANCGLEFSYSNKGAERKYCSPECQRHYWALKRYYDNPDKYSDHSHAGYLSNVILPLYNRRCAICGWRATDNIIRIKGKTQWACGNEIHHIVPVSEGGKASLENLILLCPNHHKLADMGLIDRQTLISHLKRPEDDCEKQQNICNSADRIAKAIFGS